MRPVIVVAWVGIVLSLPTILIGEEDPVVQLAGLRIVGPGRGLNGTDIPLSARIFAVVDVWDAMTSDRPYRKALPEDEVLLHIQHSANGHFDPEVVYLFFNSKD